jgi:hypothetical protein
MIASATIRAQIAAHRAAARLAGGKVVVEWHGERVVVDAVFGKANEEADDSGMRGTIRVEFSDRDYIFPAEQLVFAGRIAEPEDGMRFTVVEGDRKLGDSYEARPTPGAKCWRSCDPQGWLIRVHTKLVKDA